MDTWYYTYLIKFHFLHYFSNPMSHGPVHNVSKSSTFPAATGGGKIKLVDAGTDSDGLNVVLPVIQWFLTSPLRHVDWDWSCIFDDYTNFNGGQSDLQRRSTNLRFSLRPPLFYIFSQWPFHYLNVFFVLVILLRILLLSSSSLFALWLVSLFSSVASSSNYGPTPFLLVGPPFLLGGWSSILWSVLHSFTFLHQHFQLYLYQKKNSIKFCRFIFFLCIFTKL